MAGLPTSPATVPVEYTKGSGAFYPTSATVATQTGVRQAVQSVNGQSQSAIAIVSGPSTGATVNVTTSTSSPGQIAVGVSVGPATAGVGSTFPPNPVVGQLFYNTTAPAHLFVWTGTAWGQA